MLEPNLGTPFLDVGEKRARNHKPTVHKPVSEQGHSESRANDDCSCTHCRRARRRNERLGAASNSGTVSRYPRLPPDYDEPSNEDLGVELVTGWRWLVAVAALWAISVLVIAGVVWLAYELVLVVDWVVA